MPTLRHQLVHTYIAFEEIQLTVDKVSVKHTKGIVSLNIKGNH